MRARASDQGFTLIEMLVVLAIIGVAAGATVLGLGVATRRVSTEAEAQRLAARIRLAADDALVTDRPIALRWDEAGYAFAGATTDAASFGRHALPRGIALDMGRPSGSVDVAADGAGTPIHARLASASERWTVDYDGLTVTAAPAPRS